MDLSDAGGRRDPPLQIIFMEQSVGAVVTSQPVGFDPTVCCYTYGALIKAGRHKCRPLLDYANDVQDFAEDVQFCVN